MPFTVITLQKVPNALRGDLSKWMQEIAPGVYVGNFNSRVRDRLWDRVCASVGDGRATLSYSYRNEIGYQFETINTQRQVIDCDGIPLVLIPQSDTGSGAALKQGFSKAAKMRHARRSAGPAEKPGNAQTDDGTAYVVVDIETTGLDPDRDDIIELGAVKTAGGEETQFSALVATHKAIPQNIREMTGLDNDLLAKEGGDLKTVLEAFLEFAGQTELVGYNVHFDMKFLNAGLKKCGRPPLTNPTSDLITFVKKEKLFQPNYQLETSLHSYGINKKVPHRALEDAMLIYELSAKVKKFRDRKNGKA
jgi:CRISPR-associated protein Cas2